MENDEENLIEDEVEYIKQTMNEIQNIIKEVQKIYKTGEYDYETSKNIEENLNIIKYKYDIIVGNIKKTNVQERKIMVEKMEELEGIIKESIKYNKRKQIELLKQDIVYKLKEFIKYANSKKTEQLFIELKEIMNDFRKKAEEGSIISENINEIISSFIINIYIKQIKDNESIDLNYIDELNIKQSFIKEIKSKLIKIASNEDDEEQKIKILSVIRNVNEDNLNDTELWNILENSNDIKIKDEKFDEIQEVQVNSSFIDKIIKRTTKYVFGKVNEETGEYEDVKVEYHTFPPRGKLKKRCKTELIELEINDIKKIDKRNFRYEDFLNLQVLIFGKNVEEISSTIILDKKGNKKENNSKIKKIKCSDDVQKIGDSVFSNLKELEEVELGKGIKELGIECFGSDSKLHNVIIGEGLEYIPDYCFEWCTNLKRVELPKSVKSIEISAFGNSGIEYIDLENIKEIEVNCFWNCKSLDEVKFGNELKVIPMGCFRYCEELKQILIPASVTRIEGSAFSGSGLHSIDIPDNVENIGMSILAGCSDLTEIKFGKGIRYIPEYCCFESENLKKIFMENVESIGCCAFAYCGLNNVELPYSVKYVREKAFEGCIKLKKVDIAYPNIEIAGFCFWKCNNIKEFNIENPYIEIDSNGLINYSNLKEERQGIDGKKFDKYLVDILRGEKSEEEFLKNIVKTHTIQYENKRKQVEADR